MSMFSALSAATDAALPAGDQLQILGQLASTGVVGLLLVLTLYALRDKDRKLQSEMAARIEDAKKYNDLSMALQREVIQAVTKLGEMLEIWERREEAQERDRKTRGGAR